MSIGTVSNYINEINPIWWITELPTETVWGEIEEGINLFRSLENFEYRLIHKL